MPWDMAAMGCFSLGNRERVGGCPKAIVEKLANDDKDALDWTHWTISAHLSQNLLTFGVVYCLLPERGN